MKDKHNHDYEELLSIQAQQIRNLERVIKAEIIGALTPYILRHNRKAETANEAHLLYRGQDLVQMVMSYPDLTPCYPPLKDDGEDLV